MLIIELRMLAVDFVVVLSHVGLELRLRLFPFNLLLRLLRLETISLRIEIRHRLESLISFISESRSSRSRIERCSRM